MSAFDLRPHHGLCIRFFQGKGYSAAFTANMYDVICKLESDPLVRLQPACDVFCACCPHDRGGICRSEAKVQDLDQRVLTLCGLGSGDVLRWSDLSALVSEKILQENRLHEVCAACEWFPLCANSAILR